MYIKIWVALIAVLSFVFLGNTAFASVGPVQSNTASTTAYAGVNGGPGVYEIGTYLGQPNGYWQSFSVTVAPNNAGALIQTYVQDCTTYVTTLAAMFGGTCVTSFSSSTPIANAGIIVFSTSTQITFTTGHYYYLDVQYVADGKGFALYGASSTDTVGYTNVVNIFSRVQYPGVGERDSAFIPSFQFQTESFALGNANSNFGFGQIPQITGGGGITGAFGQWNVLITKYPFNWVFDSYGIFSSLQSTTTTVYMPSVGVDWALQNQALMGRFMPNATSTGNWNITVFSSSTFHTIAGTTYWPTVRLLLVWLFYIELIMFVWNVKRQLIPI